MDVLLSIKTPLTIEPFLKSFTYIELPLILMSSLLVPDCIRSHLDFIRSWSSFLAFLSRSALTDKPDPFSFLLWDSINDDTSQVLDSFTSMGLHFSPEYLFTQSYAILD